MTPCKWILIFLAVFFTQNTVSQENTKTGFVESANYHRDLLPDEKQMAHYYDSLSLAFTQKFLTGYTFSVFNELIPDFQLQYSFDEGEWKSISTDSKGRFFVVQDKPNTKTLRFKTNDTEHEPIDTTLNWEKVGEVPLIMWLQPRYRIVLRGRVLLGSLPADGVDIEIRHQEEDYFLGTQSCFLDEEEYWNCLYNGMFFQEIYFDDPTDSIFIKFHKNGLREKEISLICGKYDGKVIPVKMKYQNSLPKIYRHHLSLRAGLPLSGQTPVALNYRYNLKFGENTRFMAGFETGMLLTHVSKDIPTFPDLGSSGDSVYLKSTFDTNYVSVFLGPDVAIWITDPLKRNFAIYAGSAFPYVFNQSRLYIHPYLGARVYLDMNKAFFGEFRYIPVEIDEVSYKFNPFGEAVRNTIKQGYKKFSINMGLMVSF